MSSFKVSYFTYKDLVGSLVEPCKRGIAMINLGILLYREVRLADVLCTRKLEVYSSTNG